MIHNIYIRISCHQKWKTWMTYNLPSWRQVCHLWRHYLLMMTYTQVPDANICRFHAKEYPAYDKKLFPYNMGYCQVGKQGQSCGMSQMLNIIIWLCSWSFSGSNVAYDDSMNLRNILWLAPLPSNSTRAWVAPGVQSHFSCYGLCIITISHLNELNLLILLAKSSTRESLCNSCNHVINLECTSLTLVSACVWMCVDG